MRSPCASAPVTVTLPSHITGFASEEMPILPEVLPVYAVCRLMAVTAVSAYAGAQPRPKRKLSGCKHSALRVFRPRFYPHRRAADRSGQALGKGILGRIRHTAQRSVIAYVQHVEADRSAVFKAFVGDELGVGKRLGTDAYHPPYFGVVVRHYHLPRALSYGTKVKFGTDKKSLGYFFHRIHIRSTFQ